MKKFYAILAFAFCTLISANAVTVASVAGKYKGTLTVGEDNMTGNIVILPGSEAGKVSMVLPEFMYMGLNLGDIVVLNAELTSAGNLSITEFPVYVRLLEERAYATINSTSTLNGTNATLDLGIYVPSLSGTIPVQFSGSRVQGNYQMENPGFEEGWHSINQGVEPTAWHSFNSGTGTLISAAQNGDQLLESADVRPGSTGSKSALLKARAINIIFKTIKANGNLTNGQINGGSTSATDGTKNYAFSDPDNAGFNTPFTAMPDSISFWTKYIPADKNVSSADNTARMHAVITTNAYYKDPEDGGSYANVKVAEATSNYKATSSMGWQRICVPFVYSSVGADNAAYIMITFSTNQTPGGGTSSKNAVDEVYLDDVEIIYNAELTGFTLDGSQVSFSNGQASVNKPFSDEDYTYSASVKGNRAVAYTGFDAQNNQVVIYTVAEDFAANSNGYKIYRIQMLPGESTGLSEARVQQHAQKVMIDGRIYIIRNGAWYDTLGKRVHPLR